MSKTLLLSIILLTVLFAGCAESSLREISCERTEVFLGDDIGIRELVRVRPEWVLDWYRTESSIDDREWSEDYSCLCFAMDSAKEWEKSFGNEGLYIAASTSRYHVFNAVYVGGEVLDIGSWVFIEPQNGEIVQAGSQGYAFPIEVSLEYIVCGERGITPTLRIVWETENTEGTVRGGKQDET